MKISVLSDVHLEFGPAEIRNTNNADVLILAGDIIVAHSLSLRNAFSETNRNYQEFFAQCTNEFPHVVYIMGNHEHYRGTFGETASIIRESLPELISDGGGRTDNFHFLDNETTMIDGVKFIGGTCWTGMNNGNPLTEQYLRMRMNDFNIIRKDHERKLLPRDVRLEHGKYMGFLRDELHIMNNGDDVKKVVVISHHPPSRRFIDPKYESAHEMNHGYLNDLDDFIIDHPEIALWACGHCHHRQSTRIGETNVVLNPRGYLGHETDIVTLFGDEHISTVDI